MLGVFCNRFKAIAQYPSEAAAVTLAIGVLRMRNIILVILLGGLSVSAQSIVEAAGAAAGGSVGGVAGKKVSEGISSIFSKVDQAAGKSAKAVKESNPSTPLLEVGPGVPKADGSAVPPPPPVRHAAVHHVAPPLPAPEPVAAAPVPPPAPPPPPAMTAEDVRKITVGMTRDAVLKIGEPSSRMTMFEEDHLSETFHYVSKDADLGIVYLTDGVVSSVSIP